MEKLEVKTAEGDWRDITAMLTDDPPTVERQHRMSEAFWPGAVRGGKIGTGPQVRRGTPGAVVLRVIGPQTRARRAALAARARGFAALLEATDGVGNTMVAAVRAQTGLNERDRAARARGGRGGATPIDPNRRLTTFGMRVQLDERAPDGYRLVGGTTRQRACYLRAVDRWLLDDPIARA